MNVAFRVTVGAVLCLTPSLLYLGLRRGLERLRDDSLVERIAEREGVSAEALVPGTPAHHSTGPDAAHQRVFERVPAVESRDPPTDAPDDGDPS